MNELITLDHADDGMVNGFGVLEPLHHFLVELRVGYLGANSDSSLDCLLDLSDHGHQLNRRVNALSGHAT